MMRRAKYFLSISLLFAAFPSVGTAVDPHCTTGVIGEGPSHESFYIDENAAERGILIYECSVWVDLKNFDAEFKKSFASECRDLISYALECPDYNFSKELKIRMSEQVSNINEAGHVVHDHGITSYVLTNK